MTPDAIETPEPGKSRKRALTLGAAVVALVALPLSFAVADMRGSHEGGYRHHGGEHHMRGDGHRGYHRGKFMGRMFDELDADSDGKVTRQEVDAARAERFRSIDADGDGQVTLAEIAALEEAAREARKNLMAARRISSARGFVKADGDSSGGISAEEFAAMPDRMMDRFDTDGDGAVTRDEIRDHFGKGRAPRGPRSE